MSSSKNDNIFWKMIKEQKNKAQHKKENQENPNKDKKISAIKPIVKMNSSFLEKLEKIEKKTSNVHSKVSFTKKNSLKNLEIEELEKIMKLTTFKKIIKLQNLIKESISAKERFSINKTQMINKINKNCFNYYKHKINMKEIYDFCETKKPEEHIDYIIIDKPENYFNDKYNYIYNFLFKLRNNNKMILNLIKYCPEENYAQLIDFIVNFFFEDTINSSFIQEELMLFIYLIFEKNLFEKLPEELKVDDNDISYNIFRNKKNVLYYTIKSLTRKADIRNFLCSILVDNILKLEGNRKYLSPDVFSPRNFEEDEFQDNNEEKSENDNTIKLLKRYTFNEGLNNKDILKLSVKETNPLNRSSTNIIKNDKNEIRKTIKEETIIEEDENKEDNLKQEKKPNIEENIQEEKMEKNNIIDIDKIKTVEEININESNEINNINNNINNKEDEEVFNPFIMLQNSSNYNLKEVTIDPFFNQNEANSEFIKKN